VKEYATPLKERERIARYYRQRYWSDPEFRLRKLNRSRAGFGLSPHECVSQIKTRGPLVTE
jgi:hypothetical protein